MWIQSKDGDAIYNTDAILNLYITTGAARYNDSVIRAAFKHQNKDLTLGGYPTKEMALVAIQAIYNAIDHNLAVFRLPADEEIELMRRGYETKERSRDGKKPIRRGGS